MNLISNSVMLLVPSPVEQFSKLIGYAIIGE